MSVYKFIIAIVLPLLVGAAGGYFTSTSVKGWFTTLNKPFFNPPAWLFAPVWTTLYILMGIAFFLIWQSKTVKELKQKAVTFYFIQLVLNAAWSFIFFYAKQPGLAFAEILILLIMIILTAVTFYKIRKAAGWLMLPYIVWVCFACVLNYSIWRLNS